MNAKKWAAVILVLLIPTVIWAALTRQDPQLAVIRDIRQQANNDDLSRDQRRELWGKMREEYEKLSPESQEILRAERRQEYREREERHLKEFFAMTPKEQTAALDKQIDREKEWAKKRKKSGKTQGGRGQRGGDNGGGGPGGGFGGRGGGSGAARINAGFSEAPNQRSKDRLDGSSPDARAQATEYRRMLAARRAQRG